MPQPRGVFAEAFAVGMAVVHGMRITLINMFRKPVTVHYPTVARPVTDRFRGLLALAEEDEVALQLRDEELRNAAAQIRNLSAAHKGR